MNPYFNVWGTNLLIVPEWKPVGDSATYDNEKGITLITATNRRNSPQYVDSKIHHCNLINNILPKIQANCAGASDALMLDNEGFVSETNATNVFIVKQGIVYTPHADYCLPGITRETVINVVKGFGIEMIEKRLSLSEFHCADECFTTGTMGELTPVIMIDGRQIGTGLPFVIYNKIKLKYRELTENEGVEISLINR
jgi:branched-subunit amino acid aminotransferase/4-amino-4-deoxychorismate lyase